MTDEKLDHDGGRHEFYGVHYARFSSRLAADVRREAYGEDLGQLGWRSLEEQDEIAAAIRARPSGHLLDIACGSGGPSLAIAAKTGCRLTGVDIEANAIAEARRRAEAMDLAGKAAFEVADGDKPLPFESGVFDVAVCIDAVLYLKDRDLAFADWFRLLKPGGSLLMADAAVVTGAVAKSELDVRAGQGDFQLVPPGWNEAALARCGFRLRTCTDTTQRAAAIAERLHAARARRSAALIEEESAGPFEKRQAFLENVASLCAARKLSRFLYIADKPVT